MSQQRLGLFDTFPERGETRFALAVVALLFAGYLAILPVSNKPLAEVVAFVPLVDAMIFVGELIIAIKLYTQAEIYRSRALAMLATGFLVSGLLLVPHALAFPGAFAPFGLLGAGTSSAAWAMIFRRMGFPIAVILYVFLSRADVTGQSDAERPAARIRVWVLAGIALAVAGTVLAMSSDDLLPRVFLDRSEEHPLAKIAYDFASIAVVLIAVTMLLVKRKSLLDLWLLVALAGWLTQSLLNFSVSTRFTVGWYGLYLVMLASHLIVLVALIIESSQLHARLALAAAATDREREARVSSMEALAATISEEVGQPLAALSLSASAGLNYLAQPQPDTVMAIQTLRDNLDAGSRALTLLKSIRRTFASGSGSISNFDVNDLVRETASLLARELAAAKIALRLELDEALPPILANRVQIQRALTNLLTNAIESLGASSRHARHIYIRSSAPDEHNLLVKISDTGLGLSPAQLDRIFHPFFTTKSPGRGMGLSLSRRIVEEHGGLLWASLGEAGEATFNLQLRQ